MIVVICSNIFENLNTLNEICLNINIVVESIKKNLFPRVVELFKKPRNHYAVQKAY